jgi:archaellum component FlaD/FlaE
MSELPWENKKIAEVMASVEDESSSDASGTSEQNKSSTPPIPDILANAFADTPMEEAKIEVDENEQGQADDVTQQMETSPFGDLPDLSALSGNPPVPSLSEEKVSPPELPPFMKPSEDSEISGAGKIPSPEKPADLGGIISPGFQPARPVPPKQGNPMKKRSPPPLFEPQIFSDEESEELPSVENTAPPVPSSLPTGQFPPTGTQSEDKPPFPELFPPSESSAEPNPFEVADDNIPLTDPFAPTESAVEPNPFEVSDGNALPTDPFAPTESAVESNPFEVSDGNALPTDPFAPSKSAVEPNPFEVSDGNAPSTDPFAPSKSAVEPNPFEVSDGNAPPTNPFAPTESAVESNPFEVSDGSVPPTNPFEDSVSGQAPTNPFGEPISDMGNSTEKKSNALKGSVKVPIDMGSLKKNLEGLSGITKGLLKNLTKGKSLIERMEDMREEVDIAENVNNTPDTRRSQSDSPFDANPFAVPENVDFNPFAVPDEPTNMASMESTKPEKSSQETEESKKVENIEDIVHVTPIEKPIMEMKDEYLVDIEDDGDVGTGEIDTFEKDELIPDSISVSKDIISEEPGLNVTSGFGDAGVEKDSDISEQFTGIVAEGSSSSSGTELSKKVLSRELKNIKIDADKKFENFEGELGTLKTDIGDIGTQFSSLNTEVENVSQKIMVLSESVAAAVSSSESALSQNNARFDGIEGKMALIESQVSEFESSVSSLQSDNGSIRSDLSRIEENVSELVGSYTALLAQLHESLQENEAKFEVLADFSSKIDSYGTRVDGIEKLQEESRSTSKEFSRSMSSVVDNLGKVSSDFREFREGYENKNTELLEKIESLTEYMESELKKLGARSYKGFGQNVHLSNIVKNSSNMKLCMEWLEFLMELVGRNNLPDILSYYEELGWITEKVRMELLHYADGIDFYMEKPDWKLTPDDHVKSIWFIESLAGMKVDKNRLSVIERDIEKVKKGSEIYGI